MTDRLHDAKSDPLAEHREDLAAEILRVARAEPRSRRRFVPQTLRRGLTLPLITLVLVGGAVGVASGLPSALVSPDGHEMLPANSYEWPFSSDCPTEVRKAVWHLDRLPDYVTTPGYPVQGCPTVNQLEEDERFKVVFEHRHEPGSFERFMLTTTG